MKITQIHAFKRLLFLLLFLFLIPIFFSACLQTRAQLKNDEQTYPAPARVEEVQPSGRYVIDEIRQEITRLTGRIEELERTEQGALPGEAGALNPEDWKSRLEAVEKQQAEILAELQKLQGKVPPPDPEAELKRARQEIKDKDWDEALLSLERYLKTDGKAKDEARFLKAEALFGKEEHKQAILAYNEFYEKNQKSKFAPEALYKIGLSFERLEMKNDAKAFFQELVDKYPKSSEAVTAKRKLKELAPKGKNTAAKKSPEKKN